MPINILMPALSPTMEKGNLAKWLVKEGDAVKSGQVIAEIETDKATMEFESADEGVIGRIAVAAGSEDVAVGTLIAVLLEEGESAGAIKTPSPPEGEGARAPARAGEGSTAPVPSAAPVAPPPQPSPSRGEGDDRVIASPLAKRIAEQSNIDLAAIKGSGPGGRIVKADLERGPSPLEGEGARAPARAGEGMSATPPTPTLPLKGGGGSQPVSPTDIPHEEIKLSNMRKTIARRLTEAKQSIPHIYLTLDCELDTLLKVRKELNTKLEKQGVKLSVNDLVIKAVALALKQVPDANVQYADTVMRRFSRVDVSVAVAIPNGLITPIIKDAANKGLAQISSEMADLAARAKAGKLQPEEYQGGTFSISNMGMMGIRDFCAVINPPQAGILAVGAGEQRAVVKDGATAIATVMSVTGSFDHRAIDGAVGAEFLGAFKRLIEDPILMLA